MSFLNQVDSQTSQGSTRLFINSRLSNSFGKANRFSKSSGFSQSPYFSSTQSKQTDVNESNTKTVQTNQTPQNIKKPANQTKPLPQKQLPVRSLPTTKPLPQKQLPKKQLPVKALPPPQNKPLPQKQLPKKPIQSLPINTNGISSNVPVNPQKSFLNKNSNQVKPLQTISSNVSKPLESKQQNNSVIPTIIAPKTLPQRTLPNKNLIQSNDNSVVQQTNTSNSFHNQPRLIAQPIENKKNQTLSRNQIQSFSNGGVTGHPYHQHSNTRKQIRNNSYQPAHKQNSIATNVKTQQNSNITIAALQDNNKSLNQNIIQNRQNNNYNFQKQANNQPQHHDIVQLDNQIVENNSTNTLTRTNSFFDDDDPFDEIFSNISLPEETNTISTENNNPIINKTDITNNTPTIFPNEPKNNQNNMNTNQPLPIMTIRKNNLPLKTPVVPSINNNNTNNDNNNNDSNEITIQTLPLKVPLPLPKKTLPPKASNIIPENLSFIKSNTVPEQIELFLVDSQTFGTSATLNEHIREAYNQIPDSRFDSEEKQYHFPLAQYNHFHKLLSQIPRVTIHKLPNIIEKIFVLKEFRTRPANLDKIPANLLSKLLPYQKQGILFALERNGKVMICDEMGLGKTVQAIGVSCCYKDEWPLIVICPASLRQTWADVSHFYIFTF